MKQVLHAWLRRLALGLPTVFGLARRGYFIPYRYAADLPASGDGKSYGAVDAIMEKARMRFGDRLQELAEYAQVFAQFDNALPPAPRWQQDWFPRLDGAMAYAMVRRLRPARIVEVGSGHSTRFMVRALSDGNIASQVTAIDRVPRADISQLPGIDIQTMLVHDAGTSHFTALKAGDILFIDSSHILMPGSDVDWLFNRILPMLPAGVYVHIHDIMLPDDYPRAWAWRGYNEQQGVIPLITSGAYDVEWSSHYVATRMAGELAASAVASLPLAQGALETSLWLRKAGA